MKANFLGRIARIALVGIAIIGSGWLQATSILTTTTGGDPKTAYQPGPYTFVSGDVVRGFTMFKDGFVIPGDCTIFYDAEGPVFGAISFGTGTSILQLGSDLRLGTTGDIPNPGKIDGRGNAILLGGDISLTAALTITSTLVIDGCGHTLTINNGGSFALSNANSLTLKNMDIVIGADGLNSTLATYSNAGDQLILENVNIYLRHNAYVFGQSAGGFSGITTLKGIVRILGGGKIAYAKTSSNANTSASNIYISSNATLYVGPGVTLDLSCLNVAAASKIAMADSTSVLWLDGCTLKSDKSAAGATSVGITLTKGTFLFDDKVVIADLDSTGATNTDITLGLVLGDGASSSNDVDVRVLGGAYVVLKGAMDYKHS